MIKIQKVKQRVSAVAYFYAAWRSSLGSGTASRRLCPAALSVHEEGRKIKNKKRWAGSASLETGIQVDLISGSQRLSARFQTNKLRTFLAPEERGASTCAQKGRAGIQHVQCPTSDAPYAEFGHGLSLMLQLFPVFIDRTWTSPANQPHVVHPLNGFTLDNST